MKRLPLLLVAAIAAAVFAGLAGLWGRVPGPAQSTPGLAATEQANPTPSGQGPAGSGPAGAAGVPADLALLLESIRDRDSGQLAISEEDGRFLRVLIASSGARRALEIGGASGYSAIWMGLALRETGGRLVSIEYDPTRAAELADNIQRAGLSDVVTVRAGDAFREIPQLEGTFDFVFLDAWKRDYQRFFDLVYPRLDAGGLFVGHNVVNKRGELEDFLATIHHDPSLFTTIVSPSGEGMSVSYKRR